MSVQSFATKKGGIFFLGFWAPVTAVIEHRESIELSASDALIYAVPPH